MKSRLGTATALTVALAVGLTLAVRPGASPASAVPAAPTVSGLDASTPGHVTGRVSSDQPFVLVRMPNIITWTVVPVDGGSAPFDLETWGYASTQSLQAVACSQSTYSSSSCSGLLADGVQFTPTDVTPTITWPADTTIGPGQTATVTVSDPNGGGSLRAELRRSGSASVLTPLQRNGSTMLNLAEGDGWLHYDVLEEPFRARYFLTAIAAAWPPRLAPMVLAEGP